MGLGGGIRKLRRSRAALAATLIAVIAVVAVALVLALQSKAPKAVAKPKPSPTQAAPTPSPTPSLPNTFAYISLQPGDCFDAPSFTHSVKVLTKRACTEPHDAEVVQLALLPTGLADQVAIDQQAFTLCQPFEAAAYKKQSVKKLKYYQLAADLADYKGGRTTVTCALAGGDYKGPQKLTAPFVQ